MEREMYFWVGRRVEFSDFTGVISIEIGDELIVVTCLSKAMTSHRKMCNDLSPNVPKLCNGNTHESAGPGSFWA